MVGFDLGAGNLKQIRHTHDSMQTVLGTETSLWDHFTLFYDCQRWLCDALKSAEVRGMSTADQLMLSLFGSALFQFGHCVV